MTIEPPKASTSYCCRQSKVFGPVVEFGIHNRLKICRPTGLASSSLAGATKIAGIAQLIEHFTCNEGVAGLSPAAGSNRGGSSVG